MWTALKHTVDHNFFSVQVRFDTDNRLYWIDVAVDATHNDLSLDWNQYIFNLADFEDLARKEVQENVDNFEEATSAAVYYLEALGLIYQDNAGNWFKKI